MKFTRSLLAGAAAMALSAAASANVLTYQGVTFETSSMGNMLTLDIDASAPTGNWSTAAGLAAIGIKDIGSFTSVAISGLGTGDWAYSPNELNANGCEGGASGGFCFSGTPVALSGDMSFTFTFTGGTQDFSLPHLKVLFVDAQGNKQGDLLSMSVPVPEPETYALMLAGLGIVGFMARRRKQS